MHINTRAAQVQSKKSGPTPMTRQTHPRIREAWGVEPYNQYAATETASIAAEHHQCRQIHFFEDLLVEVMDEAYRPVPPGEYGAWLLITTLFIRTQPLIRYEIKDSVRVGTGEHSCQLPFAVLESIQGRDEHTLKLPGLNHTKIDGQPLVFNRVMEILPVSGWQIQQQAYDGLVILLAGVRSELSDHGLLEKLNRSLQQGGVDLPSIRVERVAAIPKTASGKAPLIIAYHEKEPGPAK